MNQLLQLKENLIVTFVYNLKFNIIYFNPANFCHLATCGSISMIGALVATPAGFEAEPNDSLIWVLGVVLIPSFKVSNTSLTSFTLDALSNASKTLTF